jgi:pimeloyl-ACP methyl ester carboxylesterase
VTVSAPTYDELDVPVAGGDLRVGRWQAADRDAPVVLAAHGVTANHRAWAWVAQEITQGQAVTVVAPDLRGRGGSGTLPGPAGMSAHAADLAAVLDHLEVERACLVGHSMGGFVASAFASAHPDRTSSVLLVDGGLPLPDPPPGATPEQVLAATIGPAAQRLQMTFGDVAAYLDFWRQHPALGDDWSAQVEEYLAYDLVGRPPECRSSVSVAAVRDDSTDLVDGRLAAERAAALPAGTIFLRAPGGMMGEPGGLYPADLVAGHARDFPAVDFRDVPDVNHYPIVMAKRGARAVAGAVLEQLG